MPISSGEDKIRRQTDEIVEENSSPLIPSHILDQASQRIFVVSFFILIQSWKIYDIVLLKSDAPIVAGSFTPLNNFSFVLKYALIDGLFIWLLPVLNIEFLRFSSFKSLCLTIILNSITFFLISSKTVPFITGFILPLWKSISSQRELTIVGDSVSSSKVIDMESHFKGRLTIHYLPDSSARFNPFHFDKLCLEQSENQILDMPIEFNTTTDLGFLQLTHITPDNTVEYLNYSGSALKRLIKKDYSHLRRYPEYNTEDNRIFYIEVPLKEAGLYKINKVTDTKNINIRTYKSEFLISYCPTSKFTYPTGYDESNNYKCIGGSGEIEEDQSLKLPLVNVFGVSPMTIKINVHLNGQIYTTINTTVGEKVTSSPLDQTTKDISWLKALSLTRNTLEQELLHYPKILSNAKEGKLEFHLVETKDYLGNVKRYNPISKDKDVWFEFKLRQRPTLGITDSDPSKELIIDGTKRISFVGQKAFKATDFPVTLEVSYDSEVDELSSYNISKLFKNQEELSQGIIIDKPGQYKLIQANNKFCRCEIDKKSNNVVVKQALPPTIDISAEPIVDKCLGTTGYTFDLKLVGKAPFNIKYHVYQKQPNGSLRPVHSDRGSIARVINSPSSDYNFKFSPPAEGNYVIVFNEVKDVNYYDKPVKLNESEFTYSTYFNQISKVSFFEDEGKYVETKNLCSGDETEIPVFFHGNGPYTFQVDFVDLKTEKKLATQKVTDVLEYTIKMPPQLKGKSYRVKISEITDKFACNAEIDSRESVIIKSREDVPEAQLSQKAFDIKLVEGDYAQIPIDIKSSVGRSNSDKYEYKVTNLYDENISSLRVLRGSSALKVKEEGIYSLVSYTNNGCPGKVTNAEKTVKVSYYPKPNLTVTSDNIMKQHTDDSMIHLNSVCQSCPNSIKLNLEGSGPFTVDFELKYPNGRTEGKTVNINKNDVNVKLPTSESGRYECKFAGVYDSLYTKAKLKQHPPLPSILYEALALPEAKFEKNEQFTQICENRIYQSGVPIATIPIALTGKYPFKINATFTHENNGKVENIVFDNIVEPELKLFSNEYMGLGEHVLTINEISDANGCTRKDFSSLNNYVVVVTEVPSIARSNNEKHFCVGDHIAYELSGIPPFKVFYNFNDKARKAESTFNFRRLASKPGILSIEAIQDSSASKCLVNYTQTPDKYDELFLHVHDLPSVEVNRGDYIIEDIHEGDQTDIIFTFHGTPPFTLTYTRTVDEVTKNRKKPTNKIVETYTVTDIQEYEYSTLASLEGTYEAIEVADAYCKATRNLHPN